MFGVALFGGRVPPLVPRDIPYFPQGVCPVAHGLRFAVRVQLLIQAQPNSYRNRETFASCVNRLTIIDSGSRSNK